MTSAKADPSLRVLVVDADVGSRRALARELQGRGFRVEAQEDAEGELGLLEALGFDVVLASLDLPGRGLELLDHVKARRPNVEVLFLAGAADAQAAEQAFRRGAFGAVARAAEGDELARVVERAAERGRLVARARALEERLEQDDPVAEILGGSRPMREALRLVHGVARTDATVLLEGEPGTGKELLARRIHGESSRTRGPFEVLHCSAVPETAIEAELFGGPRGRPGLLERADRGTAYLADVDALPPAAQLELVTVLERGEVTRGGAPRKIDARVVASTSADLKARVHEGRFRSDLFFRVAIFPIHLPPLRRRKDDIPPLAYLFLKKHAERIGRDVRHIGTEAMRALREQPWPGNAPELESAIAHAVITARGDTVVPSDLPFYEPKPRRAATGGLAIPAEVDELAYGAAKERVTAAFEAHYVERLLERFGGNRTRAAAAAGMDRSNFRKLVKRVRAGSSDAGGERDDPSSKGEETC